MRKAVLLYNPVSGRRRASRLGEVEAALEILLNAGVEASVILTGSSNDAAEQARRAVSEGCDTVFACGGDGTVHDVLQGLAGSGVALAVIPLGTANCLAHDLGLPLSASGAARAALTAKPLRITLGRVAYQDAEGKTASRYFTVIVGVGMDAYLLHKLDSQEKVWFGMAAYYARATWAWLTGPMERFRVKVEGQTSEVEVSQLLAVRIRNFGGVLRELAPGASLEREELRLVLFRTRSRWAYLRYALRGLAGAGWQIPGIELLHASGVSCRLSTAGDSPVYVEADGELLGKLPAEIIVVPRALTVLVP